MFAVFGCVGLGGGGREPALAPEGATRFPPSNPSRLAAVVVVLLAQQS